MQLPMSELLKKLKELQKIAPHTEMDLQTRIFWAYRQKTLAELLPILQETLVDFQINTLTQFLAENWRLIKGTLLCYTAIPDSDVTLLLCDIAQFIEKESNDKKLNSNNSDDKNSNTQELCALQLLMPGLSVESILDTYPSLNKIKDLQQVLKTHILGRNGEYLIPVKQLGDLAGTLTQDWCNSYYDYGYHSPDMLLLTAEEHERLIRHSPYTEALFNAHNQYEICLKEQGSLLAHLRLLCRLLYFNSVLGVGKEKLAGTGAYDAIIQFFEYYSKLSEAQKETIPPDVIQQIELLRTLASNAKENKNTQDATNIETCIARRREALETAIKPVEKILAGIGLDDEAQASFLQAKKQQIDACKEQLVTAIEQKKYSGQDKLGLTQDLMELLGITFTISSPADLDALMRLSSKEMDILCQPETIQQQIVNQFGSFETLIFFIHQSPPEKLKGILPLIRTKLHAKFFYHTEDLIALLITMNGEYCQTLCETMKGSLLQIITEARDFNKLLEPLSLEQRTIVYDVMKDHLPQLIEDNDDFDDVVELLSPPQQADAFEVVKTHLATLIKNPIDLVKMFRCLSSAQCTTLCGILQDRWQEIIKNGQDFQTVHKWLFIEQIAIFYDAMKDYLPQLINSANDLKKVIQCLSLEQGQLVCLALKGDLLQIIRRASHFEAVLVELSLPKRAIVFEVMEEYLLQLIKKAEDFRSVLLWLSDEQRTTVYKAMQDILPKLILNSRDFNFVLEFLSPAQRIAVYEAMKDRLLPIYHPGALNLLVQYLPVDLGANLCAAMSSTLSKIIQNTADIEIALKSLSLEQAMAVCMAIKDYLPQSIKNVNDLKSLLLSLPNPEHCRAICTAMHESLPQIIKNIDDCKQLIEALYPVKCIIVCAAMKDTLLQIINNAENLTILLKSIHYSQHPAILSAIKDSLPQIIKSAEDLNIVLAVLSPDAQKIVYEVMQSYLPKLIPNNNDLKTVLQGISPEQQEAVRAAVPIVDSTVTNSWEFHLFKAPSESVEQTNNNNNSLKCTGMTVRLDLP